MSNIRQYPDFLMRASAGLVFGITPLFKFGENQDIDTATAPEDIIAQGGSKLFPTTASTISTVSTSAEDAETTGTGLHILTIVGLDVDYNILEEDIILTGVTPVVTSGSFLRVDRIFASHAGSSQAAVGTITATHDEGTISIITPGHGQTQDAVYTVPEGHLLLIDRFKSSIERTSAGAGAEIHFEIRAFGTNVWREQATVSVSASGSSFVERDTSLWFSVPAKTDVRMRCTQVAANNTALTAAFDGLLIDLGKVAW